jgi:chemotaxis protein CheD
MSRSQIDIFLQPGEWYFGDRNTRIRTLLGSCVAITLWHPSLQLGGMCHFLLPTRSGPAMLEADGRYGDEAMTLLVDAAIARGTRPQEYEAKVFGGGDMFGSRLSIGALDIGGRNIDAAKRLLERHGVVSKASSVGNRGYRNVFLDVATGHVWVRHVSLALPGVGAIRATG